jgi:Na+/H+-dicarboxylate symporter
MKKKLSLPVQIVIALILGVIVGLIASFIEGGPAFTADYLKPFGTIFVNLLKFIVVPVVLLSMIQGIVSMEDMKKVGSVGWKTVAFFLVTTAIACVIGLVLGNVFDKAGLFPTLALGEGDKWTGNTSAKFMDTLVNIFPSNMWTAFTKADMLQVIVIALFFGGSILAAGEKATLVRNLVDSAYAVIEKLMGFIISLSPIGVFTMMAWVVATQGAAILGSLGLVLLCAYIAYAIHAICVYSVAAKAFGKVGPLKFFKGAAAAMMFAFTSTSSAATLPVSKKCAEDLGADKDVAAFVLPLGATINMDGTAIYQCVATIFLARCMGMELTIAQMITVVVTATLASIGTAGVSGAGMIMLAMVLTAMGIPVDMIMIIYGVDRLFDMGRTCLNVTGDIACSTAVTQWEAKRLAKTKK